MSELESPVSKLIRLKRHERPPEAYFEDFLVEFQQRRDDEAASVVKPTAEEHLGISGWVRRFTSGKWLVGAGVAYAACMIALVMWPQAPPLQHDPSQQPIIFEPNPAQPKIVTPPKTTPTPSADF